jgi:antitoxin ParD1/3/4
MTIKLSISLTDDQHSFAKSLVDTGKFSSVSAVLQRGTDLLRQQMEDNAIQTAALKEVMLLRRANKFITGETFDEHLANLLTRKRSAYTNSC